MRSLPLGTHQTVSLAHERFRLGRHSPPGPPPRHPPPPGRDADSVGLELDQGRICMFHTTLSDMVIRSWDGAVQRSTAGLCPTQGQRPNALVYSPHLKRQLRRQCLSGTCPRVGHRALPWQPASPQQWPLSQVGRWYKRSLTGSQGTSAVQPTTLALLFACSALSTERRQGDRGIQEVSLGPEC